MMSANKKPTITSDSIQIISGLPKVSIIVPVYNVEVFLPACLESLLAQTLRDIEIICIDDASTDRSLYILRTYAASDARIKIGSLVVNGRQGAARNLGLRLATAPYIGFVDADDLVLPHHFEALYQAITEHNADIVITPLQFLEQRTFVNKKKFKMWPRLKTEEQYWLQKWENALGRGWQHHQDFSEPAMRAVCADMFMQVMSKLYTASLLEGLTFPEKVRFEDIPFTVEASAKARKLISIPDRGYCYRRHLMSTTSKPDPSKVEDMHTVLLITQAFIDKAKMQPEEKTVYLSLVGSRYPQIVRSMLRKYYYPTPRQIQKIWNNVPPSQHGYLIKRLLRRYILLAVKISGPLIMAYLLFLWLIR
jgi:glycosyltransferase involved in cell wall biosynthesis